MSSRCPQHPGRSAGRGGRRCGGRAGSRRCTRRSPGNPRAWWRRRRRSRAAARAACPPPASGRWSTPSGSRRCSGGRRRRAALLPVSRHHLRKVRGHRAPGTRAATRSAISGCGCCSNRNSRGGPSRTEAQGGAVERQARDPGQGSRRARISPLALAHQDQLGRSDDQPRGLEPPVARHGLATLSRQTSSPAAPVTRKVIRGTPDVEVQARRRRRKLQRRIAGVRNVAGAGAPHQFRLVLARSGRRRCRRPPGPRSPASTAPGCTCRRSRTRRRTSCYWRRRGRAAWSCRRSWPRRSIQS
jgi:hypothetical protein